MGFIPYVVIEGISGSDKCIVTFRDGTSTITKDIYEAIAIRDSEKERIDKDG